MLWLLGIIALKYIVLHSQPECTHIYRFVLIVGDSTFTFFLGGGGIQFTFIFLLPQPHGPKKHKTQYF